MARNDRYYNDNEDIQQDAAGEQYEDEQYEDGQYEDEQYEGEQYANEEQPSAEEEELSEEEIGAELDRLLYFLEEALTQSPAMPLSNKRMVNVEMCLDIVANIRECLPDAIRYSQQIVDQRDRIIRQAETEASAKVNLAQANANSITEKAVAEAAKTRNAANEYKARIEEETQRKVVAELNNNAITAMAEEEAARIIGDARAEANEKCQEAARYVEELLRELERDVQSTLDAVQRSIKNVTGQG